MPDPLIEFSQAILKLNKEKKFAEALKYFKANKVNFIAQDIAGNAFLISAIISALRHIKKIEQAFLFLENYQIRIDDDTKEQILTQYGWLVYDKYKTENQLDDNHEIELEIIDEEDFEVIDEHYHGADTETIVLIKNLFPLLLKHDTQFSYNVLSKLFNIIPKTEKKKANANWKLVSELCDLLPPDRLKTDCESREVERKGKKVMMEFASDRENWYAYKTKALFKLGRYQECYEVSSKALEAFDKFHYSNDIWFARRIALSKKKMGNSENAIEELLQILSRKHEWFIEKELAELYHEKNDTENAFKYSIQAINNFGDLEYKVDLLFLLGALLKTRKETDLSFKHYSLARLIRISEGWNIPPKLISALDEFGKTYIPTEELQLLKNELKKYWNSFNHEANSKLSGKIDRILNNNERGADGFIIYNVEKSIYFRINSGNPIISKLKEGLEVEFKILPAIEGKREMALIMKVIK